MGSSQRQVTVRLPRELNLKTFTGIRDDPHVIEECILDGKLSVLGGFYSVPLGRSCQGGIATIGKAFDNL